LFEKGDSVGPLACEQPGRPEEEVLPGRRRQPHQRAPAVQPGHGEVQVCQRARAQQVDRACG